MPKSELTAFADIFKAKQSQVQKKAPAYPWQDLALKVIAELDIPNFKRSSVFKICKEKDSGVVTRAINDTKELCQGGEKWKYFFKVIDAPNTPYKPKKYGQNTKYNQIPR